MDYKSFNGPSIRPDVDLNVYLYMTVTKSVCSFIGGAAAAACAASAAAACAASAARALCACSREYNELSRVAFGVLCSVALVLSPGAFLIHIQNIIHNNNEIISVFIPK